MGAMRRAVVLGICEPATAASHVLCAEPLCIWAAVGWPVAIVVHIAIFDPLQDIAEHIMKPQRLGCNDPTGAVSA